MAEQQIERANTADRLGFFLTPLSMRGIPTWAVYVLALLGVIYILNPTAGILELLPDNLPFVGNLDEGVAFALLWYGLVELFETKHLKSD